MNGILRRLPFIAGGCLLLFINPQTHASHASPDAGDIPKGLHWSYQGENGPEHWGQLSEHFATCNAGQNQSPIEIQGARFERLPNLSFSYRSSPLTIVNDGHTIRVVYDPGSYLILGSRRFELRQFHFHTPSEHRINGKHADMVMHLVHQNRGGEIVEVAVPMHAGNRRNAMMERLLSYLPTQPGERHYHRNVGIKPIFLIPPDRSYYTYTGSMTEPPCSENVTWILLKTPLEVSSRDIERFRSIMGQNNRPLQAINARPVLTGHR